MKTLVSHPTGNRNVRGVLDALVASERLAGFYCAFGLAPDAWWLRFLPAGLARNLRRRSYPLPGRLLRTHPLRELIRQFSMKLGWDWPTRREHGWACVDAVYHSLDRFVARRLASTQATAVYCYEDGALATFTRAKELGMLRVYDLPIAYWETLRRLINEERERLPEWAGTLGGGLTDSQAKLDRKAQELSLADIVVVPSQFVADSLPEWAKATKRVVVSPFGSPVVAARVETSPSFRYGNGGGGKRLRVLFAGSMGQRKGLGDLMAAVRLLNRADVELLCMGSLQAPMEFYEQQCPGFTHEKGRPHAEVLELMRSCDVFCLPSIVEGRALVMQEAMSQGLPLIITPNTGGADLVAVSDLGHRDHGARTQSSQSGDQGNKMERGDRVAEGGGDCMEDEGSMKFEVRSKVGDEGGADGEGVHETNPSFRYGRSSTGFLVPIRSPEAIAEAIAWCADHRDELPVMGRAAQAKAAEYTWEAYGERIVAALQP